MFTVLSAYAGIMPATTRVIFDAKQREQTLMLSNTNEYPVIVQSWVDDGSGDPINAKAPFIVTPAVFRLLPGKIQAIRIVYNQDKLPEDRESLFWLNIYEIPPVTTKNANDPRVTLAMNMQLKLFYRPANMKMEPAKAIDKLSFNFRNVDGKFYIEANNPTPYHISFTSLLLFRDKFEKNFDNSNYLIIKPKDTLRFPLDINPNDSRFDRLKLRYLDDRGAQGEKEFPISSK